MTKDDQSHIEELAHLYVDGAFDRRELLRRVVCVTGSIAAATVALESLGVAAQTQDEEACGCEDRVPEDAHDLEVTQVQFPGAAGTIFAHRAIPSRATPSRATPGCWRMTGKGGPLASNRCLGSSSFTRTEA